ncbi:CGNR zinc finger domain-containing protein [Streptomyces sp. NBC_01317]|uniref:CGNR zinc finger domain-containing protein n=1 Tax=Streptomyces sp. NBC_01317 TaxID=2903822 RepID=UPI002E121E77|nr:CGNR zinc finger domain-containing protein [Streptomyces sp. NBC_01317]
MNLAADLANHRPETVDELADRCRAAGLVPESPATGDDLDRTRTALDAWERLVDADGDDERADLLTQMLAEAAAYPRPTFHDGTGWHLLYRYAEQPLGSVLFTLFTVGTTPHLAGRGMHRLRRCEVPECNTAFADTSPTGRRRYCSQRCDNRDAVR